MINLKKEIDVPITPELSEWLAGKELEGYKKTTFMRHVIERYIAAEREGKASLLNTARNVSEAGTGDTHRLK